MRNQIKKRKTQTTDLPRLSWLSDVATSLGELLFKKLLLLIRFASLPANREVVLVEKEVVEPVTTRLLLSSSKGLTLLELLMLVLLLLLILLMLRLNGSWSSAGCCGGCSDCSAVNDWKLLKSINWLVGGGTTKSSLAASNGLVRLSVASDGGRTGASSSVSSKCVRNFASTVGGFCVLDWVMFFFCFFFVSKVNKRKVD